MEGMVSFKHSGLVSVAVLLVIFAASAPYSVATRDGLVLRQVVAERIKNHRSVKPADGALLQEIMTPFSILGGATCVPSGAACQTSWSSQILPCCKGQCGAENRGQWKCHHPAGGSVLTLCYRLCPT